MNIYFDCEFTGLHKDTTLISIGLIAEDGRTFYAEFDDYDKKQLKMMSKNNRDWIQKNVIDNLKFKDKKGLWTKQNPNKPTMKYSLEMKGHSIQIMIELKQWFEKFENVELIADGAIPHDYMLIRKLFNGKLPSNVVFNKMRLHDKVNEYGLRISDFEKSQTIISEWQKRRHNALEDAKVIKKCYEQIGGLI